MTLSSKPVAFMLATVFLGVASNSARPEPGESTRFLPATLARFEIVLGRLQLSSEYFRLGAAHERTQLRDGRERTRSISISTYRGKPTLQFRDNGSDDEVELSFKANRNVEIERSVGSAVDAYKLIYRQPPEGPITLRVEFADGRGAVSFESSSLWHLAMEEPKAFSDYMQPCLSQLEPSLQITRSIPAVRELMNNPLHQTDAQEVKHLIEQLDAESSSERYNALSRLESMGVAAEYGLRQSLSINRSSQHVTSIKQLLSSLQPTGNDTPMRVAVWISSEFN